MTVRKVRRYVPRRPPPHRARPRIFEFLATVGNENGTTVAKQAPAAGIYSAELRAAAAYLLGLGLSAGLALVDGCAGALACASVCFAVTIYLAAGLFYYARPPLDFEPTAMQTIGGWALLLLALVAVAGSLAAAYVVMGTICGGAA